MLMYVCCVYTHHSAPAKPRVAEVTSQKDILNSQLKELQTKNDSLNAQLTQVRHFLHWSWEFS